MKVFKKLPAKQLEKYSTVILQLSLVLVLYIVYQLFEFKTIYSNEIIPISYVDSKLNNPVIDETIVIDSNKPTIEMKKKDTQPLLIDEIVPEKNPIIEEEFVKEEKVIEKEILKVLANEVIEPENIEPEKFTFAAMIEAPVFKGCEGLSKSDNKRCFTEKIKKFVLTRFDNSLAVKAGLNSGKHKIFAQFVIDKEGFISDIQVKAPHIQLKKEVVKIVEKLPKFIPGRKNNKPVNVSFTLPITFFVE